MRLSIFIGLLTLFIGMSLISGICEMQYLSGTGDQVSVFYKLMHPTFTYDFFANLGSVFFFDYAFFNGTLSIIRYLIFLPIGIATLASIGLALIRGISSS